MIKVISLMRHDFLNHLQVISGYLQLNKKERAGEYIREVTHNLQRLSKVVHLKVPEMAAAFLLGEEMAAGVEARTVYNVQFDLEGCSVPGVVAGQALHDCLFHVFRFIDRERETENPCLMIDIYQKGENCGCTLKFTVSPDYEEMEASLAKINAALAEYRGQLCCNVARESRACTVEMVLPRTVG
jgi:hypothetical protein